MTWTAPMTAVSGNTLTASQFNTYVRNNLNETAPAKATTKSRIFAPSAVNQIAERRIISAYDTNQIKIDMNSTWGWVDGGGPSVSAVTGSCALVFVGSHQANITDDGACGTGYAITGATNRDITADDELEGPYTIVNDGLDPGSVPAPSGNAIRQGAMFLEEGLNPGTNVFTLKYLQGASGDAYYLNREIIVMAL